MIALSARHPRHDVTDPAPAVEAAVNKLQLGFARRHEDEPDGGAEEAGAAVDYW